MKSCKPYKKTKQKNIKILNLLVKNWKLRVLCSLFHLFHVICKISSFNMWTAKHLAQASFTELTLLVTKVDMYLKLTEYKKVVLNAWQFTYSNLKSCKSHEKMKQRTSDSSFQFFINSILMFFLLFFHVVCKISNLNMWTEKHLAQASYTELTLKILI